MNNQDYQDVAIDPSAEGEGHTVMWRANGDNIERVLIARESPKFVWVAKDRWGVLNPPRQEAKDSDYQRYCESWELAHATLIERAEAKLKRARKRLQEAQDHYGNVKGLKKPPPKSDKG